MKGAGTIAERKPEPSGAEKARRRVAKGLPAYTEKEQARRKNYRKGWHQRKWQEFAPMITALKLERGCTDCGYRAHPAALQFDHLPGSVKLGRISALANYSRARIIEEIAKCEVVCANCHAIRTTTRWQDGTTEHPGLAWMNNKKALVS